MGLERVNPGTVAPDQLFGGGGVGEVLQVPPSQHSLYSLSRAFSPARPHNKAQHHYRHACWAVMV